MTVSVLPSLAGEPQPAAAVLRCPVPYEEINREAISATLKPEEFTEGMRHDLAIRFNGNFYIYHSMMMGHTLIPSQSSKIIKTPTSNSEFGASYTTSQSRILGRITKGGMLLRSKSKYDLTHNLTLKVNVQLPNPQSLFNFEYKGCDYRAQFQVGTRDLLGATYIQSVSPHLSLGTQVFWAGWDGKYTFGHALRYNNNNMVATAQFNGSGMSTLSYVHKISEKVSIVSDFKCNSKDVTASFGYDHKHSKGRVKAKIDSNGVVTCSLQRNDGLSFFVEIDNKKQDHKLGFRLSCGADYHEGAKGRNSHMMNSFNFS